MFYRKENQSEVQIYQVFFQDIGVNGFYEKRFLRILLPLFYFNKCVQGFPDAITVFCPFGVAIFLLG